jgi:hypothetical protein
MSADRRPIIEELFISAGQRQPVVKGAFLEEASEGGAELRREVELLLSNPEVSPAEWADQAIEERYPRFVALLGPGLRHTPRWSALAKLMNLPR